MKSFGIFEEVIHVQVSKGYELAGETAFKPMNPGYIVVGYREITRWRYTDISVVLQFTLVTQDVNCCFDSAV